MGKCEVCGRETNRIYRLYGYVVCSKHMHQVLKYGHPLDNNPRTNTDLNDYYIQGQNAIFNLYNQKNEKIGEFIVDLDDIEKIKYKKWRLNHGHVITGLPYSKDLKKKARDISHIIMDISPEEDYKVVDHIDGNPYNNKKNNLRICTQTENTLNKAIPSNNTSGFMGVWYDKRRGTWNPEIRKGYKRWHLKRYYTLEEAVYARMVAEEFLFEEYNRKDQYEEKKKFTQNLPQDVKDKIAQETINKLTH